MEEEKVVATYDALYACDVEDIERKAVERYKQEEHRERNRRARERAMIREEQERKRRYYLNQRILGLFLSCLFLVLGFTVELACLVFLPFTIWMTFTKKMWLVNDYWEDHGGREQWD